MASKNGEVERDEAVRVSVGMEQRRVNVSVVGKADKLGEVVVVTVLRANSSARGDRIYRGEPVGRALEASSILAEHPLISLRELYV